MNHGACNVIYIDRRARADETIRRGVGRVPRSSGYFELGATSDREFQANVDTILLTFNQVFVCCTGQSGIAKIRFLENSGANWTPTLVLIDISYDEEHRQKQGSRSPRSSSPRPPSPRSPSPPSPSPHAIRRFSLEPPAEPEDIYGMHLLVHISSEIQQQATSKLVVPIAVLSGFDIHKSLSALRDQLLLDSTPASAATPSVHGSRVLTDPARMIRYLDAGAVDVLTSPVTKDRVHGLAVHAYRVYKEVCREKGNFLASKRNRKLSWVGVDEEKPYAYLREAMVSGLLNGICNPDYVGEAIDPSEIYITPERHEAVAKAIGTWAFSAHEYTEDELLHGAQIMLEHALKLPELEKWRIPRDKLTIFLIASRKAYNSFVLYHNFRHVSDVLQAIFYFLLQIGTLPPYPEGSKQQQPPSSAVASLLKPFDALTLLISAIGHDVGHPGVNNAFLVALNSPLAQLYNDRSVLEAFHCAAYSQLLRRYWPACFNDNRMRQLMIKSILATDMGLHFNYMSDMGNLQDKLHHSNYTLDGYNLKSLEEFRELACGLLIKCADISNVARKFEVAAQWASILTDEFTNQGNMEKELNMPSCLFGGPPVRDSIIKMGESQISFMNIFASPLFEGVTDLLPAMQFSVDEILLNKATWAGKIEQEKLKWSRTHKQFSSSLDGVASPMSMTPIHGSHEDLLHLKEIHRSDPQPVTGDTPFANYKLNAAATDSRRSSSGKAGHLTGSPLHSASQSRRSSRDDIGLPNRDMEKSSRHTSRGELIPVPGQTPDISSRRSSGASKDPPRSIAEMKRSSNPLFSGQREHLNGPSTENQARRGSADASFTAILVSTPGPRDDKHRSSETSLSKTGSPLDSSAQHSSELSHNSLYSSTNSGSLRSRSAAGVSPLSHRPRTPSKSSHNATETETVRSQSDAGARSAPQLVDVAQKNQINTALCDEDSGEVRRPSKFGLKFWKKKRKGSGT